MALDEGGGKPTPPRQKKKRRPAPVVGERGSKVPSRTPRVPRGVSAVEENRVPYRGSSNPAFQRTGFSGDIFSFNRRAELANAAFATSFGYEPTPGLLLDLIRAPVLDNEYEDLLKIPRSFQRARAQGAIKDEPQGIVNEGQEEFQRTLEAAESGPRGTLDTAPPIETAGLRDDLGLPGLALIQIGESLVYAPAGAYEAGKAFGFDVRDVGRDQDYSFTRSREMGKQVAKGVVESYRNPLENPGYIFMDALGLVSGGAGAAGRVSRFRKTGKARDLARKPEAGTFELGGEQVLLSENTFASVVQKALLERRKRGLERRRTTEPPPFAGLPSRDKIRGQFTTEAKIGREARARQRAEHTIAMENVRELQAVAGWAINSSRALSKMPRKLKKGLSRGEQKAIQVLSTDQPGGWEAQLALHREFHQRQIANGIGDPKAHQRQLGDLDMAEVVFMNPRPRFEAAARLVREVVTEGELLKISALGLDAATAQSRVASYAEVLRGGIPEEGAQRLAEESFYLPSVPRRRARKPVAKFIPVPRPGRFGIPEPRNLPELTHWFSGKSLRWGDYRIDATHLAGESYSRAVRLVALRGEHKRLLAQATDKKRSEWDIPIRDTDAIPDELRDVVNQLDEGAVTKKDIDRLNPNFQEAMYQHLFPNTEVKGVKWVDSRIIGDAWRYPNEPGFGTKLATAINEPFRTAILFIRPAYGVGNVLGNSGMLMMQSFGAPNNMRKAMRGNKRYGEKNMRTIAALVGESKSLAFSPDDLIQTKISRTLARGWSALIDQKFREAAFIHNMERKGYKTKEDVDRLLDPKASEAKVLKDRVEISRRSNKDMVEFNNLTPFEKNTMRHLVFVYPWVSRSLVWSLRTMVEHPHKTWGLVQLGKVGEEAVKEDLGEALPEWFTQMGYFQTHTDEDGTPRVVNPSQLNTFTAFNETLTLAKSFVNREPYAGIEEYSSPALELINRVYSGHNEYGIEYEHRVKDALKDQFSYLPQVRGYERRKPNEPDLPADERPSFVPGGFMEAYGPLIIGGFWPRTPDTEALASDYFRDQPKELRDGLKAADRAKAIKDRLAVERRSIWQAERDTARYVIGRSLPDDVKDALEIRMHFAESYANAAIRDSMGKSGAVKGVPEDIGSGRTLTGLEKRYVQIQTLFDLGRINEDTAQELSKGVTKAAERDDLDPWVTKFEEDYLNAKALTDWWDERDEILDISANVDTYIKRLRQRGLYTGVVGKPEQVDTLRVGQEFYRFQREAKVRAQDTGERSDLVTLDNAQDREWQDAQDKPITVNGKKYPSPVRLGWAKLPQEDQLNDLAEWSTGSWDSLSDFEKELVGRKPAKGVSRGWVAFHAVTDGYRGNVSSDDAPDWLKDSIPDPLEERSVSKEHKIAIAKWVDKNISPGFYKDFLFSAQPEYQRIRVLPVVTKSKASAEWKEIMGAADVQFGYIRTARDAYDAGKKPPYTITSVQQSWDDYVKQTMYPYFQENGSETLRNELELLGGVDFLRTLIND